MAVVIGTPLQWGGFGASCVRSHVGAKVYKASEKWEYRLDPWVESKQPSVDLLYASVGQKRVVGKWDKSGGDKRGVMRCGSTRYYWALKTKLKIGTRRGKQGMRDIRGVRG